MAKNTKKQGVFAGKLWEEIAIFLEKINIFANLY